MFLLIAMVFIWVFLTGELTLGNIGFGFLLSAFLLYSSGRGLGTQLIQPQSGFKVFKYLWTLLRFIGFFIKELISAGKVVFISILRPNLLKPGIVAVPLDLTRDEEITLLANLITLTPGTLSLDVSSDKKVIYVHSIQVDNPDKFRQEIKEGFETRVREVLNP